MYSVGMTSFSLWKRIEIDIVFIQISNVNSNVNKTFRLYRIKILKKLKPEAWIIYLFFFLNFFLIQYNLCIKLADRIKTYNKRRSDDN